MIIGFRSRDRDGRGMEGYEGCHDCERETQEEGGNEHSQKITSREEEGSGVKGVSSTHLAIAGDGTGRENDSTLQEISCRTCRSCYEIKKKSIEQLWKK